MSHRTASCCCLAVLALCLAGCALVGDDLHYLGDEEVRFYKGQATDIDYPAILTPTAQEVQESLAPHTVDQRHRDGTWDLGLGEAIRIALENAEIIRQNATFLSRGNALLRNPDGTTSVLDPAIQETGILLGNRGVEAALSDFDADLVVQSVWSRDERIQNNPFGGSGIPAGRTLVTESADFQSSLRKPLATGGAFTLSHDVNYLGLNAPNQLFNSFYTGNVAATFRQPLLAGAGADFTRIAGPLSQNLTTAVAGVSQGVVISRINSDIQIADFEMAVRDLVRDVEQVYWDLYLAYRNFDAAAKQRVSALEVWRITSVKLDIGQDIEPFAEAQARDQLYSSEALEAGARSTIYETEVRLRRLLGLPINDGRVIRPADEPTTARFIPDWPTAVTEALSFRPELRRQKWNIKSLDLQLGAARSLVQPRLDLIAAYRVNGFGDRLLDYSDDDDSGGTAQGVSNFYEVLTQGDQTGWDLGFQMTMPFGFREANSLVRNLELRLAKSQKALAAQEQDIAAELAVALQQMTRSHATARHNLNRLKAAKDRVARLEARVDQDLNVDMLLRAQSSAAQAEAAYYGSVVAYNQALADFQYRKGTLLENYQVHLDEGPWVAAAYDEAIRRAERRTHSLPGRHFQFAMPPQFASDTPVDDVQLHAPAPSLPVETEPLPVIPPQPGE